MSEFGLTYRLARRALDGRRSLSSDHAARIVVRALQEQGHGVLRRRLHDAGLQDVRTGDFAGPLVAAVRAGWLVVSVDESRALRFTHRVPDPLTPPAPELGADDPPEFAELEPPTAYVSLTVLSFDGDAPAQVHLPLYVNHRDGQAIEFVRADETGTIRREGLPPTHSYSFFSGHKPEGVT